MKKNGEPSTRINPMHDSAFSYLNRSIEIYENSGYKKSVLTSYFNLASLLMTFNKISAAEKVLAKASLVINETRGIVSYKQLYICKFKLDSIKGSFKSAIENYKMFVLYSDSLRNEENTKKQTRLEMQFEFDKKISADSIRAVDERKLSATRIKSEKNKSYSLIGGLALVLIFTLFVYNRFKVTKRQKIIIEDQKLIVEEKNKDIIDSINYAKRIQSTLLPSEKYIGKNLNRLIDNTVSKQ